MSDAFHTLDQSLNKLILGQQHLVERLQIALLADGHLLVEGAPGLAKTRAIKSLAGLINASFQRIQFTPDLLPADITGSDIFRPEDATFTFQPGPVFNQLILADEINRAPAKVQSALLEAMGERQISVNGKTMQLPELFLVMATQNPIEQEGTYALPEAQLDRFLLHVTVDYPDANAENDILELARAELKPSTTATTPVLDASGVMHAREAIMEVHMAPQVQNYLVQLVMATRQPSAYHDSLADDLEHGASPRATIALDRCARARAWLLGRDYVTPDDIQSLAHDCLRHRLILSLTAHARGQTTDQVIDRLLDLVPAV